MSAISASASSILVAPVLTRKPSSRLHPVLVEHGVHRHDALELGRDRREVALLEHAGGAGRLERVGRDRVPAAEHEVVERGQRHEVLDQRVAALAAARRGGCGPSAVSEPIGAVAGLAGRQDAGDERRRDGAEAGEQDAEVAGGGGDRARCGHAAHRKRICRRDCKICSECLN